MREIWKDIKGFEGLYQVSNTGFVKSLYKRVGNHWQKEKIHSINRLSLDGYVRIALSKDGKTIERGLQRLVAQTFILNPDNKPTVNHKDGNKRNNHVDNLEWNSREENMQHAYDLGLKKAHRGSSNYNAKLTDDDVREIKRTYKRQSTEYGIVALAKKYGVSNAVLSRVIRGETYTNVE